MPNEITAEMLARKVYSQLGTDYDGPIPSFWTDAAETFLSLTRAYAALQAQPTEASDQCSHPFCGPTCGSEPTEAPGRVRCWITEGYITDDITVASAWAMEGHTVTPGHFTPDTEAHE